MTRFLPAYSERYDEKQIEAISARHQTPPLVARALIRRGLIQDAEIEEFLHADRCPLAPERHFVRMDAAVERIRRAALMDEPVCVYGDYDADGICATAILYSALCDFTDQASYFIPSRHDEGYGLHRGAIDALIEKGVRLIVTVDNGVSANDEIAYAKEHGVDVIVTDHHQPQGEHPDCAAVLSAAEECGSSPLCGAGVAMALALALLPDAPIERFLPLAAIATISDMVPLIGENRTIVLRGLPLVAKNIGVRALLTSADMLSKPVTETTVGFFIAPRLNAAGRIGDAEKGVRLLLAQSLDEALNLANELENDNTERRTQEAAIFSEAQEMANACFTASDRALVLKKENWNVGVVGIVASRLTESYHVPAIVFSEAEGVLTGSGRSIQGVNLFKALTAVKERFLRYGGHEMAAGVTMEEGAFEPFRAELNAYLVENYDASAFQPSYTFEERGNLIDFSMENVKALASLAPFGEGNREPVYLFENARLSNVRPMGRERAHLSCEAEQFHAKLRLVGFSMGKYAALLALGDAYDLLATASINTFNGVSNPELYLKQIRRHPDGNGKIMDAFWREVLYNKMYVQNAEEFPFRIRPYRAPFMALRPDKPRMQNLFRALSVAVANGAFVFELAALTTPEELYALLVFTELGFFDFDPQRGVIKKADKPAARELTESVLYRYLLQDK